MASAGYGTEVTVESIWATLWDTTQFDHINKLIGTKFNFYISSKADTDTTSTDIIDVLAAETHELFALWNAMVKSSAVNNPWDFIRIWWEQNLSGNRFPQRYSILIKKCQTILGDDAWSMSTVDLPDKNDRTY